MIGAMTDPAQPNLGKELEGGIALGEPFPLKDIGTHEMPLPKEVIAVGVSQRPTNVKLPQVVQQQGVAAIGQNPVSSQAPSVALPLTDDQIAQGLKVGVTSSWRWLAEWCIRRLKQLQRTLRK
ncbi:hypothetical protein A2875_05355 [Candidatus Gottesmanbacteria bacterium RIFCSPHIGHO2_01_FULL_46_14]|uniref:Uncharacterized protein n=2 Tax=Candidatus Gottesmaniibacteriota TaxID=1752720 RepID=A0A1F5ZKI7_9BACT|nr:MAG: hypothetical protein A2875_05355 [Candidatus Gottesmanbacteria bacterium RIFCSPHIGHO2_01_FULL_46_14]OGG28580.1 MAG: hypothetical protein A2971_01655 [Candidatus Gottesmanbacteria bacterium RIFCSPLOWO2_01_FULL_46_21]